MRPTGRLHIGHYFGALENWVKLQNDPQYECFFFVADWHALTSDYADTYDVAQNTIEIAIDWLASGLDPEKATMFIQSSVPEHAELNLLLSMVTPLGWLERVPTYKEAIENIKGKDLHTFGFLGYPILQSADIVIYGDPRTDLLVPVGEDQAAHVELTREIVQRFNFYFGGIVLDLTIFNDGNEVALEKLSRRVFTVEEAAYVAKVRKAFGTSKESSDAPYILYGAVRREAQKVGFQNFLNELGPVSKFVEITKILQEPQTLLTKTPRIPGTDGRKMSKSYDNFISLSESDESIRTKSRVMITDPARKRRTDPGNPDVCPVYDWHKLFSSPETLAWSAEGCRTAGIGCIECKMAMADNLIKWIAPVRARREEYAAHPDKVLRILDDGYVKAREVAQKTIARVREAVFKRKEKRTELLPKRVVGKD
jgi:tryptophanyl-tRNA synthetase